MTDFVLGIVGTILYPLFSVIFLVIDAIQAIFYAFAGIGNVSFGSGGNMIGSDQITSGNSGAENDTGIVYYLLNNSLVKNMFMSILLLAFFLVIIFTVMAFIKNAYAAKPKGWKEIVGNAIKGLGSFIFLPVCVLLGVWLGNILLNAINGATSAGGSTTMARKLFIASSYNANIYRNANGGDADDAYEKISWYLEAQGLTDQFTVEKDQSMEYYADLVDKIYSTDGVYLGSHLEVGYFYNLYQINYIVLIVGGVFMLYVLGSLSAAMVRRLFFILILFIISPAVCALYPLDEGKAVGSWTGEVKKQVLSAYGAVAGMNLFYSLLPLIDNIMIGGNAAWAWVNAVLISDIIQLFVMVIGLLTVKDLISLITGFVGGDDAYSKGSNLFGNAKNKILSGTKKAIKVAGVAAPFIGGAAQNVWNVTSSGVRTLRENRLRQRREDSINSATITDAERSNMSHDDKQAVYDNLFGANKKNEKLDKKADHKLNKIADREKNELDKLQTRQRKEAEAKARDERIKDGKATFKDNLWLAGKNALKGAGKLVDAIYEETGMKKVAGDISNEYIAAIDRQAKRDKVAAGGALGEKKILKTLEEMAKKGGGHIESMSTSVLNAMGEAFGEAVAKRFFDGKLGEEIKEARDELGLDKTSTRSDLASVDTVLQRLQHFADRINSSTGEAREQYIQGAIEYARDTDAGGNEKLQEALNEALTIFADDDVRTKGAKVEFDEDTLVSSMTKASKAAGKAMADEMKNSLKSLVADVEKENRKKK